MIKHNIISVDFDGTLNDFYDGQTNPYKQRIRDLVRKLKIRGYDVHIITRRYDAENWQEGGIKEHLEVLRIAAELEIPEHNITFTNREWKHSFVKNIGACIHFDDEENERVFMESYNPEATVIWLGDEDWEKQTLAILDKHDPVKIWLSNESNISTLGATLLTILTFLFLI
jgi:hypothetical protein